ncbi:hypothetical protein B0H11DRAFT_1900302 [Mycena galericulata]|nr:hypothetical protein B0H11DRAFT_1900302 [Mycena galericulata]
MYISDEKVDLATKTIGNDVYYKEIIAGARMCSIHTYSNAVPMQFIQKRQRQQPLGPELRHSGKEEEMSIKSQTNKFFILGFTCQFPGASLLDLQNVSSANSIPKLQNLFHPNTEEGGGISHIRPTLRQAKLKDDKKIDLLPFWVTSSVDRNLDTTYPGIQHGLEWDTFFSFPWIENKYYLIAGVGAINSDCIKRKKYCDVGVPGSSPGQVSLHWGYSDSMTLSGDEV